MSNMYEPSTSFNDNDWWVFAKWIRSVLTMQPATVTFTKKDGTERVMNCTLRSELIPATVVNENATPRKKNEAVIAVYDIDSQAWRSFTVRAVKRVEFTTSDT